jgi:hypothetical protein
MGLLDTVRADAEQAVSTFQRQAHILRAKRELSHAYTALGKTAYGLVERGEVSHGDLAAGVERIKELQERMASMASGPSGAASNGGETAADSTAPAEDYGSGPAEGSGTGPAEGYGSGPAEGDGQ